MRIARHAQRTPLLLPPSRPQTPLRPYTRRARGGFNLAAPTNRRELQHALNEVLTRRASNRLDTHRASLILYSLQIVGQHLP
jgi:DNA primase